MLVTIVERSSLLLMKALVLIKQLTIRYLRIPSVKGVWSATLKVVAGSDHMDPGIINCEQTTKYNCKWNEDGPQPGCAKWNYHDEL
ncbi:hypothetical protein E3Q13_04296 [Wallemia mellicola]|uniref:Uncharacterized protein n=1 Tax=Wallemia mellicola TaxID=1708541 RepID=A0AB38MUL3_9BASI|nr:hypothetical protein E3Q13_04296 [Wallemia mellicola]TIC60537.1 hypothetical protein E3Q02_04257 [Wallemia mellicola]